MSQRLRIRIENIQYAMRHRYASYVVIPPYNDYDGVVVTPKPSWLTENQFLFDTGVDNAELRILDKDRIVNGWLLTDGSEPSTPTSVTITSESSGASYIVSLADGGRSLHCNCKGFSYRKTCSHVKEVMEAA